MIPIGAEIELPRLRQGLYRFFSVALLSPDQAHIDQLIPAGDLLEEMGVDTLAFAQPWLEMRRSLASCSAVTALAGQYIQLFESGSDGRLCPPVESFYMSSPRQGGPAVVTAELESEFNSLGLMVASTRELGADHIASQLELMALMCAQEANSGEAGDLASVSEWTQEQRQFLDDHLSRWVPRFATRVASVGSPGFYRAAVIAVAAFIDHDRELLHVLERQERTGAGP